MSAHLLLFLGGVTNHTKAKAPPHEYESHNGTLSLYHYLIG